MNRRQFAKNSIMASAMVSATSLAGISNLFSPAVRSLKKGIMWGSIGIGKTIMEKFQAAKDAGFDGVEVINYLNGAMVARSIELEPTIQDEG